MTNIFTDFLSSLSLLNLGLAFSGVLAGIIIGALPGLSATMAVAILVPFTFALEPSSGLIVLGAIYTGAIFGGSWSAILINTPGTPSAVATTFDGYPMAKSGKSKEALHYCFISSFIGGVIGIFILIFFTPVLAGFALKFGPSHMFWIAIFGVTVIATLDSNSIVKGLFSGAIGLWLATIGYDSVLGVERFIFNQHCRPYMHIIKNRDFRIIKFEDLSQYIPKISPRGAETNTTNRNIDPFPKNRYFKREDMIKEIELYESLLVNREVITPEEWKALT